MRLSLDKLNLPALRMPELGMSRETIVPEYVKEFEPAEFKTPYGGGLNAYGIKGPTGQPEHRGSSPYGLQPRMWSALQQANRAMQAAGLGVFTITDGFRSYDAQVALKSNPQKKNLAATPGNSIHGLGYAADLSLTKAQAQWLNKNGSRFGLYAGAGYSKEPWHWQLIPSLVK